LDLSTHLSDREVLKSAQACLVSAEVEATPLQDEATELTLICGACCLDYTRCQWAAGPLRQQVKQVWDSIEDGHLVADVGGFLASQGLYNHVKDGCIVVSIKSSKYLNKQLMLHCSLQLFILLLRRRLKYCLSQSDVRQCWFWCHSQTRPSCHCKFCQSL